MAGAACGIFVAGAVPCSVDLDEKVAEAYIGNIVHQIFKFHYLTSAGDHLVTLWIALVVLRCEFVYRLRSPLGTSCVSDRSCCAGVLVLALFGRSW